jgi:CubicO group peptidase (beta-lactamase class C family)
LRTKRRRIALALVTLAAAGAAGFLAAFGRIASGYAATITALQVFGSGDSFETVRAERLDLPLGLGSSLSLAVVHHGDGGGEASAMFMGAFERRAAWRPGLGVTRVAGDEPLEPSSIPDLVPQLSDDEPWPGGESEELAPLAPGVRAALESALDRAFVEPASGRSRGTHAVAVVRDGRLVAERYRPGYDRHTPILGWSMTKSVTATLFARLLALGKVTSKDERALVPEWSAPGDPRGAITYDQCLRMTSGLEFFANYDLPWSDSLRMLFASPDAAAYAAAKELAHPPGTVWSYSDGTSNVLARCIRTLAAGDEESRSLFPQRELFALLSMSTAEISVDASGNWVGSSLMQASARDWARFGWLYANDGVFEGRRVLPEGWVDYAASATPSSPHHCYGAHFWRYDERSGKKERGEPFPPILAGVLYAAGHEGQFVWIDRARRLVLVRLGVAGPARFDADGFASESIAALTEAPATSPAR